MHRNVGARPRGRPSKLCSHYLEDLHVAAEDQTPVQALETALDRTGYAVWLATHPDGPGRLQQVELLHALLEQTVAPDLAVWLTDLHLGETDSLPNDNAVNLLTVHGSKGREWPVVFVCGVEGGLCLICGLEEKKST